MVYQIQLINSNLKVIMMHTASHEEVFKELKPPPITQSFKKISKGHKSYRTIKRSLEVVLLSFFLMTGLARAQNQTTSEIQIMIDMSEGVDPVGREQHSRLSTIFDGVTPQKYITYLKLDGTQQGVRTTIADLEQLNRPIDYTVMLWFKPQDVDSWGQRYQSAFEFENSLQCYFTSLGSAMCESVRNSDKLISPELKSNVLVNQWAHLAVSGRTSSPSQFRGESYMIISTNTQGVVSEDSRDYLVMQQVRRPFSVCLGGCDPRFTFIGGLRDFTVLSKYSSRQEALQLKNQFLSWDKNLLAYYRFNEDTFLKDYYRMNQVQFLHENASVTQMIQGRDYIPNDICPPLFETKLFHQFSMDNDVDSIQIDSRWTPRSNGWAYTTSMWLFIQEDSCSTSRPEDAAQNCFLVRLQDSFMVFQPSPNQVALFIFNDRIFNQFTSRGIFVPRNQWINIQVTMNQFNGFQMQVYDALGRMISQGSDSRDLKSANVRTKQLRIFRGYRGLVKAFNLLTERVNLPYQMPHVATTRSQCIVQVYFSESMMKEDGQRPGTTNINNLCSNSRLGSVQVRMRIPPKLIGEQNTNYPIFTQAPAISTSLASATPLFDGIACNDGSKTSSMISKTSIYQAHSSIAPNQTLTSATVEFWFRTPSQFNETTFLFQLIANRTNQEFLAIYYDSSYHAALICAPLGRDLIVAPFMIYQDYTATPQISKYWLHISCSFDNASINSTLYQHDTTVYNEWEYSNNRSLPVRITNQTLDLYIGNNRNGLQGMAGMVIKEFRLWSQKRTQTQIRRWRFQQVDPRSLVAGANGVFPLVSYIRFSEANFKEFNFASIVPQSGANPTISFRNVEVISQNGLTICPIGTFYDIERLQCFSDPVEKLVLAIYPIIRSSNSSQRVIDWVFDSSDTHVIDPILRNQLRYSWTFVDDPIAQRYIVSQNLTNQPRFVMPSSILRDENYYQVRLNISNIDKTYSKVREVKFVPINCQQYVINGQTPQAENNYTKQRSSEDISFTVDFVPLTSYCGETTFFNQLNLEALTFEVSPQLAMKPKLRVQAISNTSARITIPKEEQFKFDISPQSPLAQNGFKIFLNVQLTNSVYKANVESEGLTFQHVVYQIRFLNEISGSLQQGTNIETVVPRLKVLNEDGIVLAGENAVLDAGETFVTNRPERLRFDGLNFTWVCPNEISQLCTGRTGRIIDITENQFKAARGQYNLTYVIQVRIDFTRRSGVVETFRTSANVRWIQVYRPEFNFLLPYSKILVSADRQDFRLAFKDPQVMANINQYRINWSISPNITLFNLSSNNLTLSVFKDGFLSLTQYTIIVEMQHINVSQAYFSRNYNFTTQTPPYGGTINLLPPFSGQSEYILVFKSWKGAWPPLAYRVSSTGGSNLKLADLSNGWVAFNQSTDTNFTLKPTNFNPLLVEITDYTEEIYSQLLSFQVAPPSEPSNGDNNSSVPQNDTQNGTQSENQNSTQGGSMNGTQNGTEQNQSDTSLNTTQLRQKFFQGSENQRIKEIQIREEIVSMVYKEVQDAMNGRQDEMTDRIGKALKTLLANIQDSEYFSEAAVHQVLDILKLINDQFLTIHDSSSDKTIISTFATSLGYLYPTSLPEQELEPLLSQLLTHSCRTSSLATPTLQLSSLSLSHLILARPSLMLSPHVKLTSLPLLMMLSPQDHDPCISSISVPLRLNETTQIHRYQEWQVRVHQTQLDLSSKMSELVEYRFPIEIGKYQSNRTVCVGRESDEQWSEEVCETSISIPEREIVCKCNAVRAKWVSVWTNSARLPGAQIQWLRAENGLKIHYEVALKISVSFCVAVILTYAGLVTLAFYLDKRDKKAFQSQQLMTATQASFQENLLNLTGYSWVGRQSEISEFAMLPHKSLIEFLIPRTYPLIEVFGYINQNISRKARLQTHLLQLSIYMLICVCTFWDSIRDNQSSDTLTNDDMTRILSLGALSLLILMPFNHCLITSNALLFAITFTTIVSLITSFVLIFLSITQQPIVIYGVLASYLFGLSLGLTLSPLIRTVAEICLKTERVRRLEKEVAAVRQLVMAEGAKNTGEQKSIKANEYSSQFPKSSAKKRRGKRSSAKFADLVKEEDMKPQPSEEPLESQDIFNNKNQESMPEHHQTFTRIMNNSSLDNSVTPIKPRA